METGGWACPSHCYSVAKINKWPEKVPQSKHCRKDSPMVSTLIPLFQVEVGFLLGTRAGSRDGEGPGQFLGWVENGLLARSVPFCLSSEPSLGGEESPPDTVQGACSFLHLRITWFHLVPNFSLPSPNIVGFSLELITTASVDQVPSLPSPWGPVLQSA